MPPGRVDEISAELLSAHSFAPGVLLVGLGGGRVIDATKAIAGAVGARCGAIPTTLSGAEMTPFHRTPAGVEGARLVRPALVLADPELMASAPAPKLAATAMNALAHALEALYTPLANPVTSMAALRAASLLATEDRESLALGALLAGYASGSTGIAVHHAVCQTLVRTTGTPHAETNAVMLPHSARLMEERAPEAVAAFRDAVAVDLDGARRRAAGTRRSPRSAFRKSSCQGWPRRSRRIPCSATRPARRTRMSSCAHCSSAWRSARRIRPVLHAFVHEAFLSMAPGNDIAAPGAAITVELCGRWEHEPPCPLAPHHTRPSGSRTRSGCAPFSPSSPTARTRSASASPPPSPAVGWSGPTAASRAGAGVQTGRRPCAPTSRTTPAGSRTIRRRRSASAAGAPW